MIQPVKVLVIQPAPGGWLVQTVGGRAPHFESPYASAQEIAQELPAILKKHFTDPLPPQPETPPTET